MAKDVTVQVERLSKKYCGNLRRSLRYGLQDLGNELLLRKKATHKLRPKEFWALQDVNFELRQGDSMAVVGVNGSGKTTLLKMLQGLIRPSRGRIVVRGKVGALITLGAGFQPVLSGRENIYINAAILGVPKQQVNRKLEEIIEFADIGRFIDSPVRTYSSGMKTRLGFAVATHLVDPDVLLIDEVMATGDLAFKQKCYERMSAIVSSGATVVLVTHSMRLMERLCQRAILLNKGVVQLEGTSADVRQKYYENINIQKKRGSGKGREQSAEEADEDDELTSSGLKQGEHANIEAFEVVSAEIVDRDGTPRDQFEMLEAARIRIDFVAHEPIENLITILKFQTTDGIYIASFSSFKDGKGINWSGAGTVDCLIPEVVLREGQYWIDVGFFELDKGMLFRADRALMINVIPDRDVYPTTWSKLGLIYIPTTWNFEANKLPSTASSSLQ